MHIRVEIKIFDKTTNMTVRKCFNIVETWNSLSWSYHHYGFLEGVPWAEPGNGNREDFVIDVVLIFSRQVAVSIKIYKRSFTTNLSIHC